MKNKDIKKIRNGGYNNVKFKYLRKIIKRADQKEFKEIIRPDSSMEEYGQRN
jgi:hypothetical protein